MGKIMKQEKEELTGLYTADTAKMMIEEYLEKEQEMEYQQYHRFGFGGMTMGGM